MTTSAMAASDGDVVSAKPMRLQMPEPRFQPITTDHDGSSAEDVQEHNTMPQEDAQSIFGVSIGHAQTRLTSPQTPTAEKAAALAGLEGGGLLDGAADEYILDDPQYAELLGIEEDRIQARAGGPKNLSLNSPQTSLPSPWRASPKTFERQETAHQEFSFLPTNMLADLNVRRYMSSMHLPSMPKTPSFKDFSVPSISSILGATRSRSPLRSSGATKKRANTIHDSKPTWSLAGRNDTRAPQASTATHAPRDVDNNIQQALKFDSSTGSGNVVSAGSASHHKETPTSCPTYSAGARPLRRATSDQSLLLRRATSNGSSLGDDTRFQNVQDQVNSRMKAIKDSLQDSSIKLPGMPNMSSFTLSSFRPEFTRNRAHSEEKQAPRLTNGDSSLSISVQLTNETSMEAPIEGATCHASEGPLYQKNGKSHPQLEHTLEHLTGDIVIIGGYRGSILRSAKPPNRQLWVPVKVGLNIRRVNLEVGLNPDDEESMHESIFASGMLSHIGPVDMGRRLLKRLRTCKKALEGKLRVHDYGYDWRLSPHLLSRRLVKYLESLPCNAKDTPSAEKGATIIAHSMGGLISRHAVNQRPELVAGVVYAGVPQHCISILGPLRNGDEVLLSSKVLTAQVNFTLRSSYLLLPDDGKCFISRKTKEEYPVDFFDVESWKANAFSPCIAHVLPPANYQEKKTLLGSLSDSLPSLPVPGRKPSISTSHHDSKPTEALSSQISDPSNLSTVRALDPQLSPPPNTNTICTIPLPAAIAYLHRTLTETLTFRHELSYNPIHAAKNIYPPLATLYATNTPTVVAARVSSRDGIRRADAYDDLQFASGDGVCLAKAAQVPRGYVVARGGRVRTERGHVGLLGDLEGVGRCLEAVGKARREGVGLGL